MVVLVKVKVLRIPMGYWHEGYLAALVETFTRVIVSQKRVEFPLKSEETADTLAFVLRQHYGINAQRRFRYGFKGKGQTHSAHMVQVTGRDNILRLFELYNKIMVRNGGGTSDVRIDGVDQTTLLFAALLKSYKRPYKPEK